ncbi:hypothetical protein LTR62_006749 [Meristemomyces frigidus]|uniref:Developmental regulatory protein wetA n=1 Tax=Meristemomyces frigidus TaxID=1508187 RepID=A0AAN7TVS4_9PEZI|nr:hypothetical protein LTR62_006749 [Meristemomyces frigidus]
MAFSSHSLPIPIRSSNKEPEWSSICNNVFDQYLDSDDLFGFDVEGRERNSSNDSVNLFDYSTGSGSEQSQQTTGTSPIPSWDSVTVPGADHVDVQPRAQEPVDFWTKTIRALEQNAATSERKQQTLRTAKSHPDFLSLGGCPSPPAIPSSPTDQSLSVQRRRGRTAANGRTTSQARSVSRGRPSGVTKGATSGASKSRATSRQISVSPSKMMTPSRYRAGFHDVWTERTEGSSKKYRLGVPPHALPMSPPPSAIITTQADEFAAFGSPTTYTPFDGYDEQLSPLTTTLQQTTINTPLASPSAINARAYAVNGFSNNIPAVPPNPYLTHNVLLNDTAPLYAENNPGLSANNIQAFDFGFADELDPFSSAPFAESSYITDPVPLLSDPFGGFDATILPSTETHGLPMTGLGISCDPSLVSNISLISPTITLPASIYQPHIPTPIPYYAPTSTHIPTRNPTHRRSEPRLRSQTPSPPPQPAGEPRSSRRSASHSRRTSSHRRTKSTNSNARHPQNTNDNKNNNTGGGFVNFTPHDSNRILSGVAPSGSSKTKARREKEAADKRRRLSLAAVKAVVDAGGDLGSLARAGLLGGV